MRYRFRDRGIALLVALGVLAVLATLAVTFARVSAVDRQGAANYTDSVRARFLAEAGIHHAVARLQDVASKQHWESLSELSMKGTVGPGTYKKGGDTYEVVVKDAASMINVNYGDARLARMLDTLGRAISEEDPPIKPGEGARIVAWRNLQPGKRFQRISDLLRIPGDILSKADYDRVREYLTVRSWVDPTTVKPLPAERQPKDGQLLYSRFNPGPLELEPRPPVNINTAPLPVLVACLTGLSAGWTDRMRVEGLTPRGIYDKWRRRKKLLEQARRRHVEPISFGDAVKVARAIIANRNTRAGPGQAPYVGPFRSWKQFDQFIDSFVADEDEALLSMGSWQISAAKGALTLVLRKSQGRSWDRHWYGYQYEYGNLRESQGSGPYEMWATDDQGTGLYVHVPQLNMHSQGRHGGPWYRGGGLALVLNRPEGRYVIAARSGYAVRRRDSFAAYANVRRIQFTPTTVRDVKLRRTQADMLKAAFNPNTLLNKFNPDAVRYRRIDKTDLLHYTTEFSFNSGGQHELLSRGQVRGPDGKVVSTALITANARTYEMYVQTSQADFALGTASKGGSGTLPLRSGRTLLSYPQPSIEGLPGRCRADGYLMLSHYQPRIPGATFAASFSRGFTADHAQGSGRMVPDRKGPVAGDLFASGTAGHLHPDGVYSERGQCPAWPVLRNMGGKSGTVSFWIKPAWSSRDEVGNHTLFSAAHYFHQYRSQTFQVAHFGWYGSVLGVQTEAAHSRSDYLNERVKATRTVVRAGHWLHVVMAYDLNGRTSAEALFLQVNGKSSPDFHAHHYNRNRPPRRVEDISLNGNLFRLGERFELTRGVSIPASPADATIDEVVCTPLTRDRSAAQALYRVGRFYNGGDATYTSAPLPFKKAVPPGVTATGGGLPVKGRLGSIAWTHSLPYSVPGAGIIYKVRNGDTWIEVKPGEGGGSLEGKPIKGLVRYQVRFVESAREFVTPLLESPVLDEVRITVLGEPLVSNWEHVLDGDNRMARITAIVKASIEVGPVPVVTPKPIVITPKGQNPPSLGAGKLPEGLGGGGGGILEQIAEESDDEMVQQAASGGGELSPEQLAARAESGEGKTWRDDVQPIDAPAPKPADRPAPGPGAPFGGAGAGSRKGGGGRRFEPPKAEKSKSVRVLLQVTRADTGAPVRGARVEALRGETRVFRGLRTDRKGRCRLLLMSGKQYEIQVKRPGYRPVRRKITPAPDQKPVTVKLAAMRKPAEK